SSWLDPRWPDLPGLPANKRSSFASATRAFGGLEISLAGCSQTRTLATEFTESTEIEGPRLLCVLRELGGCHLPTRRIRTGWPDEFLISGAVADRLSAARACLSTSRETSTTSMPSVGACAAISSPRGSTASERPGNQSLPLWP